VMRLAVDIVNGNAKVGHGAMQTVTSWW
jgi:hypothetical protein